MYSINFKKVKIIFLILILNEIIAACCNCEDEYISKEFSTCEISISNLDNTGRSPIVTNEAILNKNAYGIRVSIDRNEMLCKLNKPRSFSLLTQTAYAFDCECSIISQYRAKNKITGLKVITLNDFNTEYPKDTDITSLFIVQRSGFKTPEDFIASDNLNLITIKNENLSFEEVASLDENKNFDLLLKTAPSEAIERQFRVIIEFADGTEISTVTTPILLN